LASSNRGPFFRPRGGLFSCHRGPSVKTLGYPQKRLFACEEAIRAARFRSIELVATLPGVPFYRAFDYEEGERYEVPLVNGLSLPVVRMSKNL
jgi:hypothetical protein